MLALGLLSELPLQLLGGLSLFPGKLLLLIRIELTVRLVVVLINIGVDFLITVDFVNDVVNNVVNSSVNMHNVDVGVGTTLGLVRLVLVCHQTLDQLLLKSGNVAGVTDSISIVVLAVAVNTWFAGALIGIAALGASLSIGTAFAVNDIATGGTVLASLGVDTASAVDVTAALGASLSIISTAAVIVSTALSRFGGWAAVLGPHEIAVSLTR